MDYFKDLSKVLDAIEATDRHGNLLPVDQAVGLVVESMLALKQGGKRAYFIGNGGSASIASHLQADFLRTLKIPAVTFYDHSLLTCMSNDYGYEYVFARPLEVLAGKGDCLLAISSSGRSNNILNAVKAAGVIGCHIITLSGFEKDNALRGAGDVNFYADCSSYGLVELAHAAICHYIVDAIVKKG
ncbi:MAG: SIS domain-containing protein [Candidatus Omnitrophota bacterium]